MGRGPGILPPRVKATVLAVFALVYAGMILGGLPFLQLDVVDAAARRGVPIGWRAHARVGIPVTLATLAVAAASLAWHARG